MPGNTYIQNFVSSDRAVRRALSRIEALLCFVMMMLSTGFMAGFWFTFGMLEVLGVFQWIEDRSVRFIARRGTDTGRSEDA